MATAKELLAQKLKQNTQKHQLAQKDNIKELKEFRRNVPIEDISRSPYQPRKNLIRRRLKNYLSLLMKLDYSSLLQSESLKI